VAVTGDKDSLQLITDKTKVKLVTTRMGQTTTRDMTPDAFREQYGFDPIHMIDLKALMGDTSDNIPGVAGIGEKTAMALIQQYGSIEALYAKLPDIDAKPAAIRKLTEGAEAAKHSYWLATIVTDAPVEFAPEDCLRRAPSAEAYPLFLKLEFAKLIEKFDLTPGWEMFLGFSKDILWWHDFFEKYSDRILFGTDSNNRKAEKTNRELYALVLAALTHDASEFEMPCYGTRIKIKGLALCPETVEKICAGNYFRFLKNE
jgi:hypothetical protein